ncbi:MAG: Cyclic-di-GMP-binding biofilm dispersal mediator protein [Luteibacter sp.]|uniref:SDR family oxidoreductase n=1 Tax=Luteibacter sp. TaxID=1886636 RepID=UPI001383935A|nr:SDR family oxidoreductase [Luteibacter sp.]KAF1003421.1 MAG: Cyclic-di-GMP-binding biofilm dispersal mediator protein [Luteibacter sp.]
MGTLQGKQAFVTGGSRGIGAAIVRKLAEQGAEVTFTYASSTEVAERLADELRQGGGKATAIRVDSAEAALLVAAIDDAAAKHGRLDILVNNAGVIAKDGPDDLGLDTYDRLFAINVRAVYAAARAATRHMKPGASIVNVGSVVADRSGFPGATLYSASKGAVQSMTRGLARDLGPLGITVNNVQPGPIGTDMNPEEAREMLSGLIAQGRIGESAEVASVVAFLAGPEARFVHSASLTVDGGYLA